jgi:hypothetical protein
MVLPTYIWGLGISLKVWLDGLILFVEVCQVWYEILYNVGVR